MVAVEHVPLFVSKRCRHLRHSSRLRRRQSLEPKRSWPKWPPEDCTVACVFVAPRHVPTANWQRDGTVPAAGGPASPRPGHGLARVFSEVCCAREFRCGREQSFARCPGPASVRCLHGCQGLELFRRCCCQGHGLAPRAKDLASAKQPLRTDRIRGGRTCRWG